MAIKMAGRLLSEALRFQTKSYNIHFKKINMQALLNKSYIFTHRFVAVLLK
jgi:hypothetical protein